MNMNNGNNYRSKSNQNDWSCSCGESNFGSRDSCRSCGMGRMFVNKNQNNVKFRPGDWFCTCGNMNFASRDACRRCFQLKANIVDANNTNQGGDSQKDKNIVMKPGDWNCSCGEMNFASRDMCRICNLPKPLDVQETSPSSPQTPEDDNNNNSNNDNDSNSNMMENKDMEWFCSCGESNYNSRTVCRRCHNNKPGTENIMQNDDENKDEDSQNNNQTKGYPKGKSQYRPGDWFCVCGNMNYSSRDACNRCGVYKNMVMGMVNSQMSYNNVRNHKMRSRDWVCNCGEMNFSTRSVCRKCKKSKSNMVYGRSDE